MMLRSNRGFIALLLNGTACLVGLALGVAGDDCESGQYTQGGQCCEECPPGEGVVQKSGATQTVCNLCMDTSAVGKADDRLRELFLKDADGRRGSTTTVFYQVKEAMCPRGTGAGGYFGASA
ncbi:hypothetical protein NHX12_032680 [Muraenolepis orangiensis]|uniref:Sodefrin-like factor n=1 Tax=Muraenolepis orangiensis TaxID=630683 RepID=A0A9Q0E9W7_9TELE|nr:hypothetical protein NHX12_032680 [Muraenolepis orangiensis]